MTLEVRHLGRVPYREALARQQELVARRQAGEGSDVLLLLEHSPVVTYGSRGTSHHLRVPAAELAARGVELVEETGRGGDVTYHGPGQVVAYPIVALPPGRRDLHAYLRSLEEGVLRLLESYGLQGERVAGSTGVWIGREEGPVGQARKIAAVGVRCARWVTSHGVAVNVTRQVHEGFDLIVPCGLEAPVTSLEEELGRAPPWEEAAERLAEALGAVLPSGSPGAGGAG